MTRKKGFEAKLYRNTGTYATPVWNEVDHIKDLSLGGEKSEHDGTTRADGGFKATVGTLIDAPLEFAMPWDPDDADLTAFRTAFFAGTPIELAIMDGPMTTVGSQGLRATFEVFKFPIEQPLEGEQDIGPISLKPTVADNPPEWITISA